MHFGHTVQGHALGTLCGQACAPPLHAAKLTCLPICDAGELCIQECPAGRVEGVSVQVQGAGLEGAAEHVRDTCTTTRTMTCAHIVSTRNALQTPHKFQLHGHWLAPAIGQCCHVFATVVVNLFFFFLK